MRRSRESIGTRLTPRPARDAVPAAQRASLGVEARRLDLGALIGATLGETEKNLDIVFAEAEAADAVLLFDEADALARLEAYPGLTLLATNMKTNIDPAFTRRLRRVIDYTPRAR